MLQDLGYTFDAGGNVTAITDPRHGDQTFGYDALDRLTSATNGATDGYGTITYTYNQIGNLLTNSQVGTYTYNASGTGSTRPHAVTSTSLTTGTETTTNTYSYDANGNLILGGGRIITWDVENRPAQMIKGDQTTRFVYDGDGGRVKKIVGPTQVDNLTGDETTTESTTVETTTTVYIGQLYVCEGTTCAKVIYAGGQRVALVQQASGATSYFHGDHLGSTSVLTDETGAAEEHNSYQPFGQVQTHTGTSDVAYKYTGQERDASTGLYFYQARYYDQRVGRFLSPDQIVPNALDPQAFNRYAYVRNNPLRYVDPTGQWWWDNWGWDWGWDWTDWLRDKWNALWGPSADRGHLGDLGSGLLDYVPEADVVGLPFVTLVGGADPGTYTTNVFIDSIVISEERMLSFSVKTTAPIGSYISVWLERAFLKMDRTGDNGRDFQFQTFSTLTAKVSDHDASSPFRTAFFQTSIMGMREGYLRIIPQYFRGEYPPVLTRFGACGGRANPCLVSGAPPLAYRDSWNYPY